MIDIDALEALTESTELQLQIGKDEEGRPGVWIRGVCHGEQMTTIGEHFLEPGEIFAIRLPINIMVSGMIPDNVTKH